MAQGSGRAIAESGQLRVSRVPDLEGQAAIWKLLKPEEIGVQLALLFTTGRATSLTGRKQRTSIAIASKRRKRSVASEVSPNQNTP
jgi:hypothetical protein